MYQLISTKVTPSYSSLAISQQFPVFPSTGVLAVSGYERPCFEVLILFKVISFFSGM